MSDTIKEAAKHYDVGDVSTWDFIIAKELGYLEGTVVKYIVRWKHKDGVRDLKKCRDYINKLIEGEEKSVIDVNAKMGESIRRDHVALECNDPGCPLCNNPKYPLKP